MSSYGVPRYTPPEIIIEELYEIIEEQQEEIDKLRKENFRLIDESIKQSQTTMSNLITLMLNKDGYFPKETEK